MIVEVWTTTTGSRKNETVPETKTFGNFPVVYMVIKHSYDMENCPFRDYLVGGFNHLEKYESQWEGLAHIIISYIMEKKKCLEPPTSYVWWFYLLTMMILRGQRPRRWKCWSVTGNSPYLPWLLGYSEWIASKEHLPLTENPWCLLPSEKKSFPSVFPSIFPINRNIASSRRNILQIYVSNQFLRLIPSGWASQTLCLLVGNPI